MKLEKEQIVTLEDGEKYIISSETVYNNDKYFLMAGVLEDESDLNNEFQIAKEIINGADTYLEEVEDQSLIETLIPLLEPKE